ncbi:hypothetical protein L3Q72_20790 [Vibrio sp. JC009]|uniref:hypothetical protein n=1 Tax=Vibrio sp. JC009 TaxID=2912314 RepID=UPI0023B0917B|nr:hypothetical protein [Vibrio sp. JC009]WED23675.1 hypothetical protein L3Q72_20790 [Vibrio sp. JC009]
MPHFPNFPPLDPPLSYAEYTDTLHIEQSEALQYLDSATADWSVPDSLKHKVRNNGELAPFYGDTVVFILPEEARQRIGGVMERLTALQEMLAVPLDRKQLHLTLHDLSNSPSELQITSQIALNEVKVKAVMKRIWHYLELHPDQRKIKMVSSSVYPCLNISVLLGFKPKTEQDFNKLINLYRLFDEVVYLDYGFRPHVTLSYFAPRVMNRDEIVKLSGLLKDLNRGSIELELDMFDIAYQHFFNMNHYETLFTLKGPVVN